MKVNAFLTLGASALIMASGAVNAETTAVEQATADAIWTGVIGGSVPSSNLIITGEAGGDIKPGTLYVNSDGTFTSSDVVLEARDYTPAVTLPTPADEVIGDRQPAATWTYMNSQVMIGGQVTKDATLVLSDAMSGTDLTKGTLNEVTGGYVQLTVSNGTEITDVPVEGEAQVIVQMAASYDGSL
ncbi:hypothetical protein JHL08_13010 [Vibrio campbellii]|uniref:hypothetical protein n=1 Tax=Vibrio campbellii TaxID=680 RepID=UPI003989F012